jgi:ornithine cyclodeaminase
MAIALSEADVKRVLPMEDLIDAMEAALAEYSTGGVIQPLRTVLEIETGKAIFAVMPSHIKQPASLGAKLVTVYHGNVNRGLPTHLATIVLLDPETGSLLALLDGRYITEARTGAVSAVSARHLANRGRHDVAIFGSGVQARSHLQALHREFPLGDVRVWSRDRDRRNRFAEEMSIELGTPVQAARTAEAAVVGAGLIVLATASPVPVIFSRWVGPGAHIMAVGACRPDAREMDSDLVARARLYVDSRIGALAEAGDLLMPIAEGRLGSDHVVGELGEVIAGRCRGRNAAPEITVFKSLGMAVEDVAAAQLAYRRAVAQGVGQPLKL